MVGGVGVSHERDGFTFVGAMVVISTIMMLALMLAGDAW